MNLLHKFFFYFYQIILKKGQGQFPGTYFRLGYVKVARIEKAFDARKVLPPTTLEPINVVD